MVETIRDSKGWLWADIMRDLKTQGELEGVVVNPSSVKPG